MKKSISFFCSLALGFLLAGAALASVNETEGEGGGKGASGLPVPRFASLKSNEVNMRTGPGTRYPIEWVLSRQGLPVEITAEYDVWRRVRDPDGDEGWVHKNALAGRRTAIVTGGPHDLRDGKADTAAIVAHLGPGVTGQLLSCEKDWCRLRFEDVKGWLPKSQIWGAKTDEVFD
jgi:SH3-like domain-containing protein